MCSRQILMADSDHESDQAGDQQYHRESRDAEMKGQNRQTDRQTDGRTNRHMNRRTDRHTEAQMDGRTDRHRQTGTAMVFVCICYRRVGDNMQQHNTPFVTCHILHVWIIAAKLACPMAPSPILRFSSSWPNSMMGHFRLSTDSSAARATSLMLLFSLLCMLGTS